NTVTSTATLSEAHRSDFMTAYAVQLFYANGGGPCYIVSVGNYTDTITESVLEIGLDLIERQDEPTLIVFPDAQSLGVDDYKALHHAALAQAADLQDRFVIMDCHPGTNVDMNAPGTTSISPI